jgi:hypothetical protein
VVIAKVESTMMVNKWTCERMDDGVNSFATWP